MEECKNCMTMQVVIDELTYEITRLRGKRRTLLKTLRLLRHQFIKQMEAEHAAEQSSLASAENYGYGRITAPVE